LIAKGRRYRKVLTLLIRFGFGAYVVRPWLRWLYIGRKSTEKEQHDRWMRFRQLLEALGPTYVKFGQILSNRPGLIPDALLEELALLQDRVPPFDSDTAFEMLEKELKKPIKELFAHIEKQPIASASIAQVYKAQLKNGSWVAVKIKRPGISEIIKADIAILKDIAQLVRRHHELSALQPVELAAAFERSILAELDFSQELQHIQKFHALFNDDPTVKIPTPYPQLCSENVLCMEFLEGIKISNYKALHTNGHNFKLIAQRGFDIFFKQIFEWGYFHADPHPGNLIVMENNVVGIFDFGMVGQLSNDDRKALVEFVIALGRDDVERIVETIEYLQGCEVDDRKGLERELNAFIKEFGSTAIKDIDLNEALNRGRSMAYRYKLKLNPDLFLLFRTISLLEGIGIGLDPQFRSLDAIKPYAFKLLIKQIHPKQLFTNKEVIFWFADWVQLLRTLPSDLRKLNSRLHNHENPQGTGRKRLETADSLRYAAAVIGLSLGFGFSLLAFVFATYMQLPKVMWDKGGLEIFCGSAALIFGLLLLRKSLRK
jgi:ubiquinone biosynthesis protein